MYGFECEQKLLKGCCLKKTLPVPQNLPKTETGSQPSDQPAEKSCAISPECGRCLSHPVSGNDLALSDKQHGEHYINEVVSYHVSGQMKLGP